MKICKVFVVVVVAALQFAPSSSPVRSPSSSPGKPLTMDDLSSDHHTSLRSSGEAKEVSSMVAVCTYYFVLHI